jgi:hypothetical protein
MVFDADSKKLTALQFVYDPWRVEESLEELIRERGLDRSR